jgi:hypothetical protein
LDNGAGLVPFMSMRPGLGYAPLSEAPGLHSRRVLARLLHITDERKERWGNLLVRTWVIAAIALGVVVGIVRIVSGPVHGYLIQAWVLVLGAPLLLILLGFVAGWVWFVLWLLARPFRPLRESHFMHPGRWNR